MRRDLLVIPILTAIVVTVLLALGPGRRLELPVRDFAMRRLADEPARAAIIVAIDERSLQEIGAWPWDRTVLAEIVVRAASSGARAVVLDVPLAEPRPGDEQLADAMRRIPTVAGGLMAPRLRTAATVAGGRFQPDDDGVVRRFASSSLPVAAASIVEARTNPGSRSLTPAFRTPPGRVPVASATDVLWHRTPAGDLRNRIVFIGATAGPRVRTAVSSADPAIAVYAAAAEAFVRGEEIRELPPVLAGIVAGVMVAALPGTRRKRIAVAGAAFLAIVMSGYLLLAAFGIAIPVVVLAVTAALSAARSPSGSPESSSHP